MTRRIRVFLLLALLLVGGGSLLGDARLMRCSWEYYTDATYTELCGRTCVTLLRHRFGGAVGPRTTSPGTVTTADERRDGCGARAAAHAAGSQDHSRSRGRSRVRAPHLEQLSRCGGSRLAAAAAKKSAHGFVVREQVGAIPATTLDGTRRDLDLRNDACGRRDRESDAATPAARSSRSVRGAPDVRVLSVASLAETQAMAKDLGLGATTSVVAQPLPKGLESRLQIYPQLFVMDRGEVVRTCARIEECR